MTSEVAPTISFLLGQRKNGRRERKGRDGRSWEGCWRCLELLAGGMEWLVAVAGAGVGVAGGGEKKEEEEERKRKK